MCCVFVCTLCHPCTDVQCGEYDTLVQWFSMHCTLSLNMCFCEWFKFTGGGHTVVTARITVMVQVRLC